MGQSDDIRNIEVGRSSWPSQGAQAYVPRLKRYVTARGARDIVLSYHEIWYLTALGGQGYSLLHLSFPTSFEAFSRRSEVLATYAAVQNNN